MALNQQQGAHKFSTVEKYGWTKFLRTYMRRPLRLNVCPFLVCFRTMNTFLIVFLVVLLCQAALCTGLMYWKQGTPTGIPSYVYTEKPKVTVCYAVFPFLNVKKFWEPSNVTFFLMKTMNGKRLLWRALVNVSEGDLDDYNLLCVILFIYFLLMARK